MQWQLPSRSIEFPRRPLVMGIVNVNDDSFSGDGTLDFGKAIELAKSQIAAGGDIIDIGAESARTNRAAISIEEEIRRFLGFFELWDEAVTTTRPRDAGQIHPPILSANTWRPEVIEAILACGKIELVNDMSGFPDDRNARLCARANASLLIMHSAGEPKIPHLSQCWADVMTEMERFFGEKIALAKSAGLAEDKIILDPGIDFAKQRDDNLTVFRELRRLQRFDRPLLVPVSRKTVIGEVLDLPDPIDRDAGTVACMTASLLRGAQIFRVHQVAAAWQTVKTLHQLV